METEKTTPIFSRPATWALLCAAAVALRFLRPFPAEWLSDDMSRFVLPWVGFIREHGSEAYASAFSNYAPAYTYLLGLVAMLPPQWWLAGVKGISIAFDLVLAGAAFGLASRLAPGRRTAPWIAAAVTLWLPSVWLNSAAWGQCDSIWASLCLVSLLMFLKDRPLWGIAAFGLALSVKLQAVFFAPAVLLLILCRKARWQHLLAVPAVYALTCLPCALAGRGWGDLLGVYGGQYRYFGAWSFNSASVCNFLRPIPFSRSLALAVVVLAVAVTLWAVWKARGIVMTAPEEKRDRIIAAFAALMAVAVPWMLPMMHDRYMYFGDVAAALCAVVFVSRRWTWTAVLVQAASASCVLYYLLGLRSCFTDYPWLRIASVPPVLMAGAAIWLMAKYFTSLRHDYDRQNI